jgi:photosystem II stability/assembly factor-like uncharacterized protein
LEFVNSGGYVTFISVDQTSIYVGKYFELPYTYEFKINLSKDEGKTWKEINIPDDVNWDGGMVAKGANLALVAGRGVKISSDSGKVWKFIDTGIKKRNPYIITSNNFGYYLGTDSGLFISNDYGNSWKLLNNCPLITYHFVCLDNQKIYAGSDTNLYFSPDNGLSWKDIYRTRFKDKIYSISVRDTDIYVGTHSGIYKSSDLGLHWIDVTKGICHHNIQSVAVKDTILFAGGWEDSGIYRASINGENWKLISRNSKGREVNAFLFKDTNIFVAAENGIYLSSNKGDNWVKLTDGNFMDIDIQGPLIYTCGSSVSYSSDNGQTWICPNFLSPEMDIIRSLAIIGKRIYAAGWEGIYLSEDKGKTWIPKNNGLQVDSDIRVIMSVDSIIFSGSWWKGIYKSTDWGNTWETINNGIPSYNRDVQALANYGNTLFAGFSGGQIFMSSDFGNNWININDGMNNNIATSFAFDKNSIYVGTWGGGVWKRPLSDIIGIEENESFNKNTLRIYPNPASDYIRISFSTPTSGKIEVISQLGQVLKNNNFVKSLEYTINLTGLTNDIYLIKVVSQGQVIVNKVIKN